MALPEGAAGYFRLECPAVFLRIFAETCEGSEKNIKMQIKYLEKLLSRC
jgi:hypothetical protein